MPHGDVIPEDRKFVQELICGRLHPGVCRHELPKAAASAAVSLAKAAAAHAWPTTTILNFRMLVEGRDYEWIGVRFVAGLFSNAQVFLCNPDDGDDNPTSLIFEVGEKAMSGLWERCGGNPAAVKVCALPSREPNVVSARTHS